MYKNRNVLFTVLIALSIMFSGVYAWDNVNYAYRIPLELNGSLYLPYSLNDTGRVYYNYSSESYDSIIFTNASYIYINDTDTLRLYDSAYTRLYYDSAGNDIGYNLMWSDPSVDCADCDNYYTDNGSSFGYEDDLVAYYHLDTFRNESVTDSSIYGNDGSRHGNLSGTLVGPPTWSTDCEYNGNCLDFDGVDDYVTTTDVLVSKTSPFTMSAWINWNGAGNNPQFIIANSVDDTDKVSISIYSGYIVGGVRNGAAQDRISTSTTINADQWYHVAYTNIDSTRKLFVDGIEQTANAGWLSPVSTAGFTIGSRTDEAYGDFNGSIDSVRIWDKALTQSEIQAEMISSLPVETDGLVTAFEFEEGTGTTTYQTGYTATSKIGSAMYFDGVDDYVNVTDSTSFSFNVTDSFTLSGWIYRNKATLGTIMSKELSSGNYEGYNFYVEAGGDLSLLLRHDNSPANQYGIVTLDQPVPINQWYHVTATWNGTVGELYIDGTEQTVNTYTDTLTASIITTAPFQIGVRNNAGYWFNGSIDEVMIYNRTLSAAEISQIYKNGVDQFSTIGELENLWFYNVTDTADNNIDNVTLTVYNQTNNIEYTTNNGSFELIRSNLPTGDITLLFQSGGYQNENVTTTNIDQYIFQTIVMQRATLNLSFYDTTNYFELNDVPLIFTITNSTDTYKGGYGSVLTTGLVDNTVDNDISTYIQHTQASNGTAEIYVPIICNQNNTISVSAYNDAIVDGNISLWAYNTNIGSFQSIGEQQTVINKAVKKTYTFDIDNADCYYDGRIKIVTDTATAYIIYIYEVWSGETYMQPVSLDQDSTDVVTGSITIEVDDIDVFDEYTSVTQTATFNTIIIEKDFYLTKNIEAAEIIFSTIDSVTNNPIPSADILVEIQINNVWTTITQGTTDSTGILSTDLKTGISTRVTATRVGYTKDPFIFTPSISTGTVAIPMDPYYQLNYTYILQGIIYRFEPYDTILAGTETTNLSFFISSAGNTIDSITYNVTWNNTLIGEETSTDSSGDTLTISFNASDRTGDVYSRAYVIINGTLLELNTTYTILTIVPGNWTFKDLEDRIDSETVTNQRFIGVMTAVALMAAVSGFAGVMHYGAGLVLIGLVGLLTALGFITYMQYAVIIGLAVGIYILFRGI